MNDKSKNHNMSNQVKNRFVGKHVYPTIGGRKIDDTLESPITTNTYLKGCDLVVDNFHAVGLSPNDITTLSMLLGLLAVYFLFIRRPILSGVFFLISYFFDCLDGVKARRFDQETEFGENWDHFHDLSIFILLAIGIWLFYPMNKWWIAALTVTIFGTCLHMGLVEEFNTNCRGIDQPNNMLRICTYISKYVEPDRYAFASNPESEELAQQYCSKMMQKMSYTRWMTDVNVVLLLGVYLISRGFVSDEEESSTK
jgi:phosphatidylglycerophosphate synthase